MSAILRAPVDLLWNGGIGTYVKSSRESNADVGDRANNALRVNGDQLRCKVVGEGGNLGFTQLGRVEAALHGVLLNTDFIDNSAGVDTSDHEVNIKILLNGEVQKKKLALPERNKLLGGDDRRGRAAGAHRQLPPEPGLVADGAHGHVAARLQAALHPHAGIAGAARPPDRIPAQRRRNRRAQVARAGPDPAGARGAAVLLQAGRLPAAGGFGRAGGCLPRRSLERYFPELLQKKR